MGNLHIQTIQFWSCRFFSSFSEKLGPKSIGTNFDAGRIFGPICSTKFQHILSYDFGNILLLIINNLSLIYTLSVALIYVNFVFICKKYILTHDREQRWRCTMTKPWRLFCRHCPQNIWKEQTLQARLFLFTSWDDFESSFHHLRSFNFRLQNLILLVYTKLAKATQV